MVANQMRLTLHTDAYGGARIIETTSRIRTSSCCPGAETFSASSPVGRSHRDRGDWGDAYIGSILQQQLAAPAISPDEYLAFKVTQAASLEHRRQR